MKKLLRFIPALALAAALLTVTALACSPDDNNPEHHENVIQTDEKKPTCLQGGYYELKCTVCGWSRVFSIGDIVPHEFGPWEIVKEPTCTKTGEKRAYCSTCNKWYPELVPATGQSWYKYYTISTTQKSLPAPRQENTTPTAGIALRSRGAPQNLPRVTFGSSGSEYSLHAPRRDIPNLSATTAARMGGPPRRPPRDTASARGSPRRRPPARRKACRSGSAQPAARRRAAASPRRDINSARGLPRRRPPAWKACRSGSLRNLRRDGGEPQASPRRTRLERRDDRLAPTTKRRR